MCYNSLALKSLAASLAVIVLKRTTLPRGPLLPILRFERLLYGVMTWRCTRSATSGVAAHVFEEQQSASSL